MRRRIVRRMGRLEWKEGIVIGSGGFGVWMSFGRGPWSPVGMIRDWNGLIGWMRLKVHLMRDAMLDAIRREMEGLDDLM